MPVLLIANSLVDDVILVVPVQNLSCDTLVVSGPLNTLI